MNGFTKARTGIITILLVVVTLVFSSIPAVNAADDETKVLESYGKLPLSFIENRGQVDYEVSYYLNSRDGTIYFTEEGIVYDIVSVNASVSNETGSKDFKRLSFTFGPIGAGNDAKLIAEHKLPGRDCAAAGRRMGVCCTNK